MKKLLLVMVSLGLAMALGCSGGSGSRDQAGETGIITVPGVNGIGTAEVTMSFGSLGAGTSSVGDWSGIVEISGENMNGTYTAVIYRDAIANGHVILRLPVGAKLINMTLRYERNDGRVDTYSGTGNITVADGANSLQITMYQVATGGTVAITGENQRFINVTLIEKNGGRLITGALVTFSLNGNAVKTVLITEAAQEVYLPVQAEQVSQIAHAYTYEIYHPEYLVLNGTLKISMNEMEADGVVIPDEYGYVNFQRLLDEDILAPVINTVVYPNPAWDSDGDFTVGVNAADNRELVSVSCTINGNTASGATANGSDYTVNIPLAWLNHGDNDSVITAVDASGNTTTVQRTITRSDNVNPYFVLPAGGSWASQIQAAGLPVGNCPINFLAADNYQIAGVTGASLVSGSTYQLVLDANLPDGTYSSPVTAADTYGNTSGFACNFTEWIVAVPYGGWIWYQKHISYSFAY